MKPAKIFLLKSFLIMQLTATAQSNTPGFWVSALLPVKVSDKWTWHNDLSYRNLADDFLTNQVVARTGVRYFVRKKISIAAGPAFFLTRTSLNKNDKEFGNEFRLWQEFSQQVTLNPFLIQNRITIEERFFSATSKKDSYEAARLRLKTNITKKIFKKLAFQVADEYMAQLTGHIFSFDQNRMMGNLVFEKDASLQIRAGYMWQWYSASISRHIFNLNFQKAITL